MYHNKKEGEVLSDLSTSIQGLSETEVQKRIGQYGLNEIKKEKSISALKIFISQFNSAVVWILIAASVISAVLKEYVDFIVIIIILVIIAILGFIQEYKAEKAIEALKKMASLKAKVIRDGKKIQIDAIDIVPGDIVVLETGDKVPADSRLIEVANLETQEAALTGESLPIKKITTALADKTPLADRKNSVFAGTIITNGRGTAVVTETGMNSQIGKIASMIQHVEAEQTPLQKRLHNLGKWLGVATVVIASIVFLTGILKGGSVLEFLKVGASLAVAAIPEGLPAVVTISLAIGTKRMLLKHSLVRKLPSVETLGSTTVICSDKTGTLTMNQMTVKKLFVNNKIVDVTGSGYSTIGDFLINKKKIQTKSIELLLKIGLLNNDASVTKDKVMGDPTEGALIVSAAKAGLQDVLIKKFKRIDEIPFSSTRKMMTTIHQSGKTKVAYTKGAPDIIINKCTRYIVNGKVKKLTRKEKDSILKTNKDLASQALRVLGFAYNPKPGKNPEKDLIFVGLQGMIDPPREEIKASIQKCKDAGIKTIMITGDHEITAKAVAASIGLTGESMNGEKLDEIDDLSKIVEQVGIFARVNPEHKIKIVEALKKNGHVVAMTGDGVNDAPALKKADIGVAMGITGTDVSKEASDMILLDDNFASIVNAVEEGRGTYDNIRKYFSYLISGNIGEIFIIFLGILFGLPLPLTATQILLINLVTDGLPSIALSADPFEPHAMKRKPRNPKEPIWANLRGFLVYYPLAMIATALGVFSYMYYTYGDVSRAQTSTFLTIGMFELYQAFACRSTIYPSYKVGYFKNKYLVLAVVSSFLVMVGAIYLPFIAKYLDMAPLKISEFLVIVAVSSIGGIIIETTKAIQSKKLETDLEHRLD